MKESLLIKLCLVFALLGIMIMFITNRMIQPKEMKINKVSEKENFVKIKGKVTQVSSSTSGTTFLKVKDDTGMIDVVVFKNSVEDVSWVTVGSIVEILGKPEKYKGKMEITASRIKH